MLSASFLSVAFVLLAGRTHAVLVACVCACVCATVYCIKQIANERDAYGESTGKKKKKIFEEMKAAQRCNTSCHGNRVMLALAFWVHYNRDWEIGSNIVLDGSGSVMYKY